MGKGIVGWQMLKTIIVASAKKDLQKNFEEEFFLLGKKNCCSLFTFFTPKM